MDIFYVSQVFEKISELISVDIEIVDYLFEADISVLLTNDLFTHTSVTVEKEIRYIGISEDLSFWESGGLHEGGYTHSIVWQAVLLALGLFPTHLKFNSNDSVLDMLEGVYSEFDLGVFELNQSVFTAMSSNAGWQTSSYGLSSDASFGWSAGPMALDLALLQQKYGLNESYNRTNTDYNLADVNEIGTAWRSIWDTGGNDAIIYEGDRDAIIDLRPATLVYEEGGGGFLSYAEGIFGGFTIAAGVVIERGVSGSGNDRLIGNDADNRLF